MTISELIREYAPSFNKYESLYYKLHADPELSCHEEVTSAIVAEHLRSLGGFEVKTHIGGFGVVGILRNGGTKTILLRAELDALPLMEKTSLPYASIKKTRISHSSGIETPVMHACGHDLHMSALLAASELLQRCRNHWQGNLVVLFQPSEENGRGAKAMVEDGLYNPLKHKVPIPDIALGGHCMPLRAGSIKTRVGVINAAANSFKVTIIGRGGHAARPHTTVDSVIVACNIVTKLQQIVSRQIDPTQAAVVTVGSIHAGTAPNVIADRATLEINIRAFNAEVMSRLIDSMTRIIQSETQIYDVPEPPLIELTSTFPLLENDRETTEAVAHAMKQHFGADFETDAMPSAGSEDFAALSPSSHDVGFVFWNYGCIAPEVWDEAVKKKKLSEIPGNHSPYFAPALQPSLTVGTEAYCVAALAFLT